jgi:hypothetical protein
MRGQVLRLVGCQLPGHTIWRRYPEGAW